MQALSAAVARAVAVDCGEPELFRKIEDATHALSAPDDWSTRWWEVPFEAVVDALCDTWREIVDSEHLAVLRGTETPGQLREVIEERGIAIEPDPYEIARANSERFGVYCLTRTTCTGPGWSSAIRIRGCRIRRQRRSSPQTHTSDGGLTPSFGVSRWRR